MKTYERTVWVELPVIVEFQYQPYEPPERGPEAQYPGCPEAIEIEGIYIGEANITSQLTDEVDEWVRSGKASEEPDSAAGH